MQKHTLNILKRVEPQQNAQCIFSIHSLTIFFFATFSISACTTTNTLASANTPQPNGPAPIAIRSSYGQAFRVIVKFRREVPYRDAAFLQDMSRQIHGRIAYSSSVSLDTHVYEVEPQRGQIQADVLLSLSKIPSVLSVETDAVVRPS